MSRVRRVCAEHGCRASIPNDRRRCPQHEQAAAQRGNYRVRRTQAGLSAHLPESKRQRVLFRDGHRCHWCGKPAMSVDHVVPVAKGGSDDESNLVAACTACNSGRR